MDSNLDCESYNQVYAKLKKIQKAVQRRLSSDGENEGGFSLHHKQK